MPEPSTNIGVYTPYTCEISKEALSSFKEVFEGFMGAKYVPVAVSEQLVSGMNYKFFCNSRKMTLGTPTGAAIISIYQPLNGKAQTTAIRDVS